MLRQPCGPVWSQALVASVLLAAVACDPGEIGAVGGNTNQPNNGAPGSPGGPGSNNSNDPGGGVGGDGTILPSSGPTIKEQADKCAGQPPSPGPILMRRLNRFEYGNTVRDLLGTKATPQDQFPSEEKKLGFDNNAEALQVSPALVEQYMLAAETLAKGASANLGTLVPCDPATGSDACAASFITDFGRKAYRRPLDSDEQATLKGVFDAGKGTSFTHGIELVLEVVLQSAPFLYRVEFGQTPTSGQTVMPLSSYEMASRLSYLVWQSMPDDELFAAADADDLTDPDKIAAQTVRMLKDQKAHDTFAHFHQQWLILDKGANLEKEQSVFDTYTSDIGPLMQEETRRFLDYVVWEGDGTLDSLLTSNVSFLNDKLAAYYGVSGVTGSAFSKVTLDGATRAGILTRGGIVAMLAKANQTSPVHRGKFVREQLLCNMLPPPPNDIVIKPPDVSATLSTRERFTQHRTDPVCNDCHQLMDPIGLGFENYDGAGRYRTMENGQKIDATGEVLQSDVPGVFDGAVALGKKLSGSDQVRNCVAKSWFRFAYGRGETKEDGCTLAVVNKKFQDAKYDMKSLIVALSESDGFRYRKVIPPGGAQ